jgi:hypothetical protein
VNLLRSFWAGIYALSLGACLTGTTHAQSDNPGAGLSAADTDVQIVYALYGGDDLYWNVTDRVKDLLQDSPEGFFAHTDVLRVKTESDSSMSLFIFFNYDGHLHFFVRWNKGPKISVGLLRETAKIDDSHGEAVAEASSSDDGLKIVFAAYGGHELFWDVTDLVAKLLRDSPEGFFAHTDDMGGDPEWGSDKKLIIIFDYNGHRHFYTQRDGGPKITEATLWAAAKMDDADTKSSP